MGIPVVENVIEKCLKYSFLALVPVGVGYSILQHNYILGVTNQIVHLNFVLFCDVFRRNIQKEFSIVDFFLAEFVDSGLRNKCSIFGYLRINYTPTKDEVIVTLVEVRSHNIDLNVCWNGKVKP